MAAGLHPCRQLVAGDAHLCCCHGAGDARRAVSAPGRPLLHGPRRLLVSDPVRRLRRLLRACGLLFFRPALLGLQRLLRSVARQVIAETVNKIEYEEVDDDGNQEQQPVSFGWRKDGEGHHHRQQHQSDDAPLHPAQHAGGVAVVVVVQRAVHGAQCRGVAPAVVGLHG